jgi:hypothetical protein
MVRTQGNRDPGISLQRPPMLVLQAPLPELSLILCSLKDINETLKECQSRNVEVEPPPFRVGNLEPSRDSKGEPPPGDIIRELQKIKLP